MHIVRTEIQHKTRQTSQKSVFLGPFTFCEFLGGAKPELAACSNLKRSEHYPPTALPSDLFGLCCLGYTLPLMVTFLENSMCIFHNNKSRIL